MSLHKFSIFISCCFLVLFLGLPVLSDAQKIISGKITRENFQPLAGATITVQGTSTQIMTDESGNFKINAGSNDTLVITNVGFQRAKVKAGNAEVIILKEIANDLSEVVVTALGIRREQKALGYAAQTVDEKAVNDARSNNWVNALSGKVAGLNLVSPGSGPVNSVRVSLRGDASLNPEGNHALIVLDGVPLNSNSTSCGVNNACGAGSGNDVPIDFGNGISDINPDDIESVTVLKGPGATALYGSRASNGALLITTKSGARKEKGIGVTVNSNVSFNNVLKWPDYQYEYGQGTGKALNANGEKYYSYGASADGNYLLPANRGAEFVYLSIPAGYAFPQQKGLVQFYKAITQQTGVFKADFDLEKLGVDDNRHHFVVWADPQIISKADAAQLKGESAPDLNALVRTYPKDSLFHGIGCGDLVWDHFELYADYKQAIGITGIPFFNCIGNHDMDLDARTDDYSSNTFKQQFGPTYYSFNRGQVHYVVLDDVFFIGTAKKYIGYVTEAQLHWLEQDLALVKPGSTVVVNLHIPTNTGAAARNQKEAELGGVVSNRKQLYKLLEPFKVHIMSGHTHVSEKWQDANIIEHVHGTVCGAWWTGPICSDGTPCGYGVYEVDGSEIKWFYKSTGLAKEHQLRIYEKGSRELPGEIAVNVWNWDEQWKVEWLEDGISKGKMEQRVALDPWAVELFSGPELPQKHHFVEPTLTSHLFFATPAAMAKEVVVKATDRFGNIFTDKLVLTSG